MKHVRHIAALTALASVGFTAPAQAAQVKFSQLLINSCVLTVSTDGALVTKANGIEMNSEAGNGVSAIMGVVAIGTVPQVSFTAPALTAPAGDSGSTKAIKYTSLSGANQAYTSSASSYTGGLLIDTYTIDAKVNNTDGFQAGTYEVTTTATCSQ